ncbi:unnamed protein product [Closterium sp. NIES-53]
MFDTGGAGVARAGGAAGAGGAGGVGGAAGAGGAGATTTGGSGGAAGAGGAGLAGALRHLLGLPPAPTEFQASVPARVRCVRPPRAPAVPDTHDMTLYPSSVPQRVVLPSPPSSSLPDVADPPSDLARASSPTVTRFLATVVADPTFSSSPVSALVAELVDFAAAHRQDYLASLASDPEPACPPSVGGEVALGCDVLEDRKEKLECLAAAAPHLATMLLAPEGDPDALDIPNPRSYKEAISGTYVNEVPPPRAKIFSGMWIFRVKRPPGSPLAFKARYVARGFSQQQGVDFFKTFSPTPKMTTLRVLLQFAAQRDYEMHSLDFSTTFLQGSLHEAIWLRRPPGFTGSFPAGRHLRLLGLLLQLLTRRCFSAPTPPLPLVYVDDLVFATTDREAMTLVKAELQVLQRFGFQFSLPQPTPLSTSHSLSAPPSDKSVELSGPYPELVGCLMYLMTCTRPDLAYPLSLLARYVAPGRHRKVHFDAAKRVLRYLCSTSGMGLVLGGRGSVVLTGHSEASWANDQVTQRSSQGYTFSLGSGSVLWRSTRSSMLGSSCEAEICTGAMAAQELRWLTYLLTDLGERPRSPPVLYVNDKAMLALCRKQRLEHITKHISLRYFLAWELEQRGQMRLAYMASRANTADVFTKALGFGDHQPLLCFVLLLDCRPAATAAAAARATAAVAGGAVGSTGGAAGAGAARGGQQRSLPLPDDPTPQQLREWVIQRGSPGGGGFGFMWPHRPRDCASQRCVLGRVEAAALGSSESVVAPGAGESAAALGAREFAVALGASASTATDPASTEALHTFALDSGASRCFFRDRTTVTPLAAPVPISLADPTRGPVVARASTVLPYLAVPSGSLSGLHLPTFSTNLLSNAVLQDEWVDTFIPGGQRVAICKCSLTGRHLATFTRQPGSGLYTLTNAFAQVAESGQVAASSWVFVSGRLAASCSCWVISHQTLLWHHRLGHPLLPRLRNMHSRLLVSSLPRSLPSLPRSPALPCLPCVEGQQRAAPHSSEFPPTTTPLQTLHMDVDVSGVLIPWIRATCRQLRERFRRDFPVLRLHSDRGVRYAAHQLNLRPRVSEPETSPTLRWTGKVGDASVFRVWGALSLVRDAKASKLSSRTLRSVFLGFPTDAPPWQLDHLRERRVFSSHDVTFNESVCFYRLHPYASHPVLLAPLFLVPVPPPVDPLPPQGPAPSGVSHVDPPPLVEPLEISSDSSGPGAGQPPPSGGGYGPANAGAASPGGTADAGGTGGTVGGVGGAAGAGGTRGAGGAGGAGATSPRGATCARGAGAAGARGAASAGGATGAAGTGGAGGTAGARGGGAAGACGAAGAGGATRAAGVGGAGADGAGGAGAAGTAPCRLFFYSQPHSTLPPPDSVLRQVLSLPSSTGLTPPLLCPPKDQSQPQLLLSSPLPAPAPHTEVTKSLTERHEPKTRDSTPLRARHVARPRPPAVPGTHGKTLRPSSVPQRVVLPEPPASSLPNSTAVFALVTELVDFAARSRLDYVASLVTESESVYPLSVGGECALSTDVLEDRLFELECLADA